MSETKLFRSEDFEELDVFGEGVPTECAKAANARLMPLVEALERFVEAEELPSGKMSLTAEVNQRNAHCKADARDALRAAYRALKGEE